MKGSIFSKIVRIVFALALVALVGAALPQKVMAASPFISITGVKAGEWVTVHATGLPAVQLFTAKMDKSATTADNGTIVGQTYSNSDGTFDATYVIPSGLKSVASIAIRIDSAQGYYAYNWFYNQTSGSTATATPTPTGTPTTSLEKLYVTVVAVEKNNRITASVTGFPANVNFTVKIGPYYTFGSNQQVMKTINSGNGGSFLFNVDLPAMVKDVSLVTIRLDGYANGKHMVAYNAFTNKTMGTISTDQPTSTPTPTSTPVTQNGCQVTLVKPTQSLNVKSDFDLVWQVKNTGSANWDNHEIDLRYQSGTKMNKYTGIYDLPKLVKPGETVTLIADMVAPDKAGTYSTLFVLIGEHGVLCNLPVTVTVK